MNYCFYLGDIRLPVTPSRLDIKYPNKHSKIDLAGGEEVVFHKSKGLAEVSFTALLPRVQYPFAVYENGFVSGGLLLLRLLHLRDTGEPVRFIVLRRFCDGRSIAPTNINSVVSSMHTREDAGDGSDIYLDVKLTEYREIGGLRD
jgi:hypothetical protein